MRKAKNWILRENIQEPKGSLQTAIGLKTGAKKAISGIRATFEDPTTEGVILADASSVFCCALRQLFQVYVYLFLIVFRDF